MMRALRVASALMLLAPALLLAQPAVGPQELVPSAQAAGQGRLRFWGLDVYDARLWVAPGFRHRGGLGHGGPPPLGLPHA